MSEKIIKISNKYIGLHKTICNPNWGSRTVITNDHFSYVELYIIRDKNLTTKEREKALAFWRQTKEFYNLIPGLSKLSQPLLSYYCFLNAVKTLLVCKKQPFKESHGLSGNTLQTVPGQNILNRKASLSNEMIKIKDNGILPALIKYLGETETRKEHSIRDILYNLPYIHRAYTLSYRTIPELFIPIKSSQYIISDSSNSKRGWLQFEIDKKYDNIKFINTLPDGYEKK